MSLHKQISFRFTCAKKEAIVKATFTSGDHCHVCTEPNNVSIDDYPVIRGVPIYFSCHFNLNDDKWVLDKNYNYFNVRRGDKLINDECTSTQIKTLFDSIEPAFQKFAEENAQVIREAELSSLECEIKSTKKEIDNKKKELEQLNSKLIKLCSNKKPMENKLTPKDALDVAKILGDSFFTIRADATTSELTPKDALDAAKILWPETASIMAATDGDGFFTIRADDTTISRIHNTTNIEWPEGVIQWPNQ